MLFLTGFRWNSEISFWKRWEERAYIWVWSNRVLLIKLIRMNQLPRISAHYSWQTPSRSRGRKSLQTAFFTSLVRHLSCMRDSYKGRRALSRVLDTWHWLIATEKYPSSWSHKIQISILLLANSNNSLFYFQISSSD